MENPIKMDDLGVTTIYGNTHINETKQWAFNFWRICCSWSGTEDSWALAFSIDFCWDKHCKTPLGSPGDPVGITSPDVVDSQPCRHVWRMWSCGFLDGYISVSTNATKHHHHHHHHHQHHHHHHHHIHIHFHIQIYIYIHVCVYIHTYNHILRFCFKKGCKSIIGPAHRRYLRHSETRFCQELAKSRQNCVDCTWNDEYLTERHITQRNWCFKKYIPSNKQTWQWNIHYFQISFILTVVVVVNVFNVFNVVSGATVFVFVVVVVLVADYLTVVCLNE